MALLRKFFRFLLFFLAAVIILLFVVIAFSVAPLDRTTYKEKSYYPAMMKRLDSLQAMPRPIAAHDFLVGYGKENITPSFRTATAGYGNRMGKLFTTVHDSIYIRTLVVDNGSRRIAIVSADLLIIPPAVTRLLEKTLPEIGFNLDNTYLGATHTHNSIGNWAKGATRFLYGSYQDSIVHFIADKIKLSIASATANMKPAYLKAGAIAIDGAVRNRLDKENGRVDSLLRVIEVHQSDSSKLLFMSYTAHATCLYSRDLEISRDYPGKLVDEMEKRGYNFAMFMAGAVGSHACNAPEAGWTCIDWMTEQISREFFKHQSALRRVDDSTLFMLREPLLLGEAQAKFLKNWRLRPGVFHAMFDESPVYLTALRLGNIVMLGTPCDFSGELTPALDSTASQQGLQTFITSFNGGYIGYITKDEHYDRDHYETRLMNWYGPGNGAYFSECMGKLIEATAATRK